MRGAGGPCHKTTQTPPATAGKRGTPLSGARHHVELVNHGRTAMVVSGQRGVSARAGCFGLEATWLFTAAVRHQLVPVCPDASMKYGSVGRLRRCLIVLASAEILTGKRLASWLVGCQWQMTQVHTGNENNTHAATRMLYQRLHY